MTHHTQKMFRLLIVIPLLCFTQNVASSNPSVTTNVGTIKGLTSDDGTYYLYMGIPFASVNSTNPFGAAMEYGSFNETYEAYDDTSICPQVDQFNGSVVGTLDCLRLNIYAPTTASSSNKLPVMVWLHGGEFQSGFGGRFLHGPGFLVRYDVILVTVNYRVGPYGFMCLDIADVPGNQGLKDQYMGMKWVYDNIEAFGGDVNNITLFGESAGGYSVELHLRSPRDKLFSKVIMQSGSAVSSAMFKASDKEAPLKMAAYLGYTATDVSDALTYLIEAGPKQVIKASDSLDILFNPCVENTFDGVDYFINTTCINTTVPKVADMPVLTGFNEKELMNRYVNEEAEYFKTLDIFNDQLNQTFDFTDDELAEMEKIVRHFYLGDKSISKDTQWPIIYFDSDYTFIHPVQRSLYTFLDNGASNVFYYMFSYSGSRNFAKIMLNITVDGAGHADELGYLFNMTYITAKPNAADQLVIDRMTTMWTNFAKYGDPTPETTDLVPVKWTAATSNALHCMKIDSTLTLINRPLRERMAFWDLFYKSNNALQKTFYD